MSQGQGGGRPIKYTKKFIENLADEMLDFYYNDINAWHLLDFAVHKRINRERLSEFARSNDKFSHALKNVKDICEQRIINRAYTMRNSTFAIFDLKCNHGWKDTQVVEHSGNANITLTYDTVTREQPNE